jgi:hypothetical protein
MEPGADNPLGFGESRLIYEFHERLLYSAGTFWDAWTPIDPAWFLSQAAHDFSLHLGHLLDAEYGDAPLCLVKDPRLCRLMPFWLNVLASREIEAKAIVIARSPGEIAASLEARNGIGREEALLIWLRHILDADRDTRATRRSFVRYRDLLNDWRAVAARVASDIGVVWEPRSSAVDAEIGAFLDQGLAHHDIQTEEMRLGPPLQEWVTRVHGALDLFSGEDPHREREARQRMDDVRHQLDLAGRVFGQPAERVRHAARLRAAALEAEREDVRRELQAQLQQQSLDSERRLAVLVRELADSRRDLLESRQVIDALLGSWSWRLTSPVRLMLKPLMERGRKTDPRQPDGEPDM